MKPSLTEVKKSCKDCRGKLSFKKQGLEVAFKQIRIKNNSEINMVLTPSLTNEIVGKITNFATTVCHFRVL